MANPFARTSSIRTYSVSPRRLLPAFGGDVAGSMLQQRGVHMGFSEYGDYDGMGLAELVRKKQVSARELLDEAIARTARIDPQINAVVVKHYDYTERQIERGLPDGPFTGVPFLLKDLDLL